MKIPVSTFSIVYLTMSTLIVGDSHVRRFRAILGAHRSAYSVFNIYELKEVNYFGISGRLVSNSHHISLLTSAVRRFRPQHLIVFIGGNDLDSCDLDFSLECVVSKLTAYLTQLKRCFHLKSVTVLSFLPREVTRNIDCLIYNQRVKEANRLLKQSCAIHAVTFWKLRGFSESREPILCDGVHLNDLGFHKLYRQIRGVLLTQLRQESKPSLSVNSNEDRGF